ncbi:MAG: single-stranded DNA-binding protein, partial [Bacteroidota bacterium]
MAKNLNRAQIIGHLGRDPEMRATASGMSVCKVSVATSEKYKSKSGEWQENTEWHRVVFFDKLADIANQYLNK